MGEKTPSPLKESPRWKANPNDEMPSIEEEAAEEKANLPVLEVSREPELEASVVGHMTKEVEES